MTSSTRKKLQEQLRTKAGQGLAAELIEAMCDWYDDTDFGPNASAVLFDDECTLWQHLERFQN